MTAIIGYQLIYRVAFGIDQYFKGLSLNQYVTSLKDTVYKALAIARKHALSSSDKQFNRKVRAAALEVGDTVVFGL